MLFHEIYGSYYAAVASILRLAVKGQLSEKNIKAVIDKKAFSESFLEIISALKSEKWKLLDSNFNTPIQHAPSMPLSALQQRWLKAISMDKRIRLFGDDFNLPDDIEPLFLPKDYVLFDQYSDGDPFDDEHYIQVFRTLLTAIRQHKKIKVEYHSAKGTHRRITCDPFELEYSEKDDKFRVNITGCRFANTLNLAGIEQCEIIGTAHNLKPVVPCHSEEYFIVELIDMRNSLERFLLHFAHFKKEAEQCSDNRYLIIIYYDKSDETEIVIRILSFGPFIKVTEPNKMIELIKERLLAQKSCGLK